jgi:hypothetical protein
MTASQTLTPEQIEQLRSSFAEYKQIQRMKDQAQSRSWDETVVQIKFAIAHIEEMNFGQAKSCLSQLLEDLPHDFGAQTFFPLFDRNLEQVTKR